MKRIGLFVLSLFSILFVATPAFAQGGGFSTAESLVGLAAAICMGVAAFGGALGQGRTASAAVEGIARNPQAAPRVQTPMIIALAMTESLVLFSFVIAIILATKF